MYFGPHLLLDLSECSPDLLGDIEIVKDTLLNLPESIGMTRISEPSVFYYSGKVPEDRGVTGVVVLAESHCSIHTFQDKGFCFVDIFSCKPFDHEKAVNAFIKVFGAKAHQYKLEQRGRGFPR